MPPERTLPGVYIYAGVQNDGLPFALTSLNNWDGHSVDGGGNPIDPSFLPAIVPACGDGTYLPLQLPAVKACLIAGYRVRHYSCALTGLSVPDGSGGVTTFPDETLTLAPYIPGSDTFEEYSSELDALRLMGEANAFSLTPWSYHAEGMNVSAHINGFFDQSGTGAGVTYYLEAGAQCSGSSSTVNLGGGGSESGVICTVTVPSVGDFRMQMYGQGSGSIRIKPSLWWGFNGRFDPATGKVI